LDNGFRFDSKQKSELFSQVQKDLKQANEDEEEEYEDQYEEEEEDEDEDFDANELLNLTDYQNKRKQGSQLGFKSSQPIIGAAAASSAVNKVTKAPIEIDNEYYDEDDNDDDGWGDDWGAPKKKVDMKNFDYANTNLNKLSDAELALHKQKMDLNFHKNQLKPGDPGFQYDKRIDFTKKTSQQKDTSWDEDNVDNYFDDDFM
jgi:hypothetical protein